MSYYTIKVEDGDIVFNNDNQLVMIESIEQSFKIYLETQYESDYRDPTYGFKLQELMNINYDNTIEMIKLFVHECLIQHPLFGRLLEINVEKTEDRKYKVDVKIELKNSETVSFMSELSEFNV